MAMLGLLVVIVLLCLAAPLYAEHVAHTDPFTSNLNGTTIVDGKTVPVMQPAAGGLGLGFTPIGPDLGSPATTCSEPTTRVVTSRPASSTAAATRC